MTSLKEVKDEIEETEINSGKYTKSVSRLLKNINRNVKKAESYNTGLVAEKLIVASYETMTIRQLEQLRYVLNQIIKKKKIYKRMKKKG